MILIRHELKRGWKTLLIWTLAISFFIIICMVIYPEMKSQMDSLNTLFSSMGSFTSAFGLDTLDYGTLKGYYGIECGEVLGIGGALFAALLGIGALAGEEKNGTAEFLLTHPRSRAQIIAAKLGSVLTQITILNLVVWLIAITSTAAIGEAVPWREFALLHLSYYFLQIEVACICFGISAFIWKGGVGIGLGLAITFYFAHIVANLTDQAGFLDYITPFGYADGAEIYRSGLMTDRLLIGLAFTLAGVGAAFWKYSKKDIR